MQRACLPAGLKETWFFDRYYDKGFAWYGWHFSKSRPDRRIGEICPTYFVSAVARERIGRDLPRCKIICVFRDPVERAYSWYRMRHRLGGVRGSFEEVLANSPDPELHQANHYATRLSEWRTTMGAENVAALFYDDLFADPQQFADSVTDFLELDSIAITPELTRHLIRNEAARDCRNSTIALAAHRFRRWLWARHRGELVNKLDRYGLWRFCFSSGPTFPPMEPDTAQALRRSYLPEIEALERFCNRDLSAWKNGHRAAASLAASNA